MQHRLDTLRIGRRSSCFLALLALGSCGVSEIDRPITVEPPTKGVDPETAPPPAAHDAAAAGRDAPAPTAPPTDARATAAQDAAARAEAAVSPPPPADGPGVVIDGVKVPKEKAIVILHIGHSNMAGRALDPASLKPYFYDTDPHLWQYQKGGVWKHAMEPLTPDGGTAGHPQGAGPGMALLHSALLAAPDAYVIAVGKGTSLEFGASCFAFRKGGLFYDVVMGPAKELKGKVTFAGLFVMLGYDGRSDARARAPGYIDCLAGLAQDFRTDLEEPDLPFVQNDYERGATGVWAPTCCGAPQVIAQLAMVPTRIAHSILVPTDGIAMQDEHHFNMLGHKTWAERAFMGLAAGDMLPWATTK